MLQIYTLEGCSRCSALVKELNGQGISYNNIDADLNAELADKVERLLSTTIYPIIHIKKLTKSIYLTGEDCQHTAFSDTVLTYDTIPHAVILIKQNL